MNLRILTVGDAKIQRLWAESMQLRYAWPSQTVVKRQNSGLFAKALKTFADLPLALSLKRLF
jgi:hypothetical protein